MLEDSAGARAAEDANRTSLVPDVDIGSRKQYGRAQENLDPSQNRKKNVIIHGLKPVKDEEVVE